MAEEKEVEFEIEGEEAQAKVPEVKTEVPDDEDDIEIEVIDDVPEADRGKVPSEPPAEVTEEELLSHSEKVRRRLQHLGKAYHDERRAKEAAQREKDELERLARAMLEENKQLKGNVSKSQTAMLEQAKKAAKAEVDEATRKFSEAYQSGDPEEVTKAQQALIQATLRADKINGIKVAPLQEQTKPVKTQENDAPAYTPDPAAKAWAEKNPWFGQRGKEAMTAFALGIDMELKQEGRIKPDSQAFYDQIDARIRKAFPENFPSDPPKGEKETKKPAPTVVAPASRSTKPVKIVLTQTAIRLAKNMGLTPEQYAREVAKLNERTQNV